jgi:DNA modification methylase
MTTPSRTTTTTATPARCRRRDPVPLAIWPVGQTAPKYQRAGRYHPGCAAHPGKMLPALARRIVSEYSAPGNLVCDPLAGTATTLVEAALLGRRAVGVELESRWVEAANANLDFALRADERPLVTMVEGDATNLAALLGDEAGRVDLVCTSPPYGCQVGIPNIARYRATGAMGRALALNYSTDRTNLGHARGAAYEDAMGEIYASCFAVLRPGGLIAVVTKNMRRKGRTTDLAGLTIALCEQVGFTYLQHVVALHAALADSDLVGRPSFFQTLHMRKARERGEPVHLVASEDVLVLSKGPARLAPSSAASSKTTEVANAH